MANNLFDNYMTPEFLEKEVLSAYERVDRALRESIRGAVSKDNKTSPDVNAIIANLNKEIEVLESSMSRLTYAKKELVNGKMAFTGAQSFDPTMFLNFQTILGGISSVAKRIDDLADRGFVGQEGQTPAGLYYADTGAIQTLVDEMRNPDAVAPPVPQRKEEAFVGYPKDLDLAKLDSAEAAAEKTIDELIAQLPLRRGRRPVASTKNLTTQAASLRTKLVRLQDAIGRTQSAGQDDSRIQITYGKYATEYDAMLAEIKTQASKAARSLRNLQRKGEIGIWDADRVAGGLTTVDARPDGAGERTVRNQFLKRELAAINPLVHLSRQFNVPGTKTSGGTATLADIGDVFDSEGDITGIQFEGGVEQLDVETIRDRLGIWSPEPTERQETERQMQERLEKEEIDLVELRDRVLAARKVKYDKNQIKDMSQQQYAEATLYSELGPRDDVIEAAQGNTNIFRPYLRRLNAFRGMGALLNSADVNTAMEKWKETGFEKSFFSLFKNDSALTEPVVGMLKNVGVEGTESQGFFMREYARLMGYDTQARSFDEHRGAVEDALKSGERLPAYAVQNYPDLLQQYGGQLDAVPNEEVVRKRREENELVEKMLAGMYKPLAAKETPNFPMPSMPVRNPPVSQTSLLGDIQELTEEPVLPSFVQTLRRERFEDKEQPGDVFGNPSVDRYGQPVHAYVSTEKTAKRYSISQKVEKTFEEIRTLLSTKIDDSKEEDPAVVEERTKNIERVTAVSGEVQQILGADVEDSLWGDFGTGRIDEIFKEIRQLLGKKKLPIPEKTTGVFKSVQQFLKGKKTSSAGRATENFKEIQELSRANWEELRDDESGPGERRQELLQELAAIREQMMDYIGKIGQYLNFLKRKRDEAKTSGDKRSAQTYSRKIRNTYGKIGGAWGIVTSGTRTAIPDADVLEDISSPVIAENLNIPSKSFEFGSGMSAQQYGADIAGRISAAILDGRLAMNLDGVAERSGMKGGADLEAMTGFENLLANPEVRLDRLNTMKRGIQERFPSDPSTVRNLEGAVGKMAGLLDIVAVAERAEVKTPEMNERWSKAVVELLSLADTVYNALKWNTSFQEHQEALANPAPVDVKSETVDALALATNIGKAKTFKDEAKGARATAGAVTRGLSQLETLSQFANTVVRKKGGMSADDVTIFSDILNQNGNTGEFLLGGQEESFLTRDRGQSARGYDDVMRNLVGPGASANLTATKEAFDKMRESLAIIANQDRTAEEKETALAVLLAMVKEIIGTRKKPGRLAGVKDVVGTLVPGLEKYALDQEATAGYYMHASSGVDRGSLREDRLPVYLKQLLSSELDIPTAVTDTEFTDPTAYRRMKQRRPLGGILGAAGVMQQSSTPTSAVAIADFIVQMTEGALFLDKNQNNAGKYDQTYNPKLGAITKSAYDNFRKLIIPGSVSGQGDPESTWIQMRDMLELGRGFLDLKNIGMGLTDTAAYESLRSNVVPEKQGRFDELVAVFRQITELLTSLVAVPGSGVMRRLESADFPLRETAELISSPERVNALRDELYRLVTTPGEIVEPKMNQMPASRPSSIHVTQLVALINEKIAQQYDADARMRAQKSPTDWADNFAAAATGTIVHKAAELTIGGQPLPDEAGMRGIAEKLLSSAWATLRSNNPSLNLAEKTPAMSDGVMQSTLSRAMTILKEGFFDPYVGKASSVEERVGGDVGGLEVRGRKDAVVNDILVDFKTSLSDRSWLNEKGEVREDLLGAPEKDAYAFQKDILQLMVYSMLSKDPVRGGALQHMYIKDGKAQNEIIPMSAELIAKAEVLLQQVLGKMGIDASPYIGANQKLQPIASNDELNTLLSASVQQTSTSTTEPLPDAGISTKIPAWIAANAKNLLAANPDLIEKIADLHAQQKTLREIVETLFPGKSEVETQQDELAVAQMRLGLHLPSMGTGSGGGILGESPDAEQQAIYAKWATRYRELRQQGMSGQEALADINGGSVVVPSAVLPGDGGPGRPTTGRLAGSVYYSPETPPIGPSVPGGPPPSGGGWGGIPQFGNEFHDNKFYNNTFLPPTNFQQANVTAPSVSAPPAQQIPQQATATPMARSYGGGTGDLTRVLIDATTNLKNTISDEAQTARATQPWSAEGIAELKEYINRGRVLPQEFSGMQGKNSFELAEMLQGLRFTPPASDEDRTKINADLAFVVELISKFQKEIKGGQFLALSATLKTKMGNLFTPEGVQMGYGIEQFIAQSLKEATSNGQSLNKARLNTLNMELQSFSENARRTMAENRPSTGIIASPLPDMTPERAAQLGDEALKKFGPTIATRQAFNQNYLRSMANVRELTYMTRGIAQGIFGFDSGPAQMIGQAANVVQTSLYGASSISDMFRTIPQQQMVKSIDYKRALGNEERAAEIQRMEINKIQNEKQTLEDSYDAAYATQRASLEKVRGVNGYFRRMVDKKTGVVTQVEDESLQINRIEKSLKTEEYNARIREAQGRKNEQLQSATTNRELAEQKAVGSAAFFQRFGSALSLATTGIMIFGQALQLYSKWIKEQNTITLEAQKLAKEFGALRAGVEGVSQTITTFDQLFTAATKLDASLPATTKDYQALQSYQRAQAEILFAGSERSKKKLPFEGDTGTELAKATRKDLETVMGNQLTDIMGGKIGQNWTEIAGVLKGPVVSPESGLVNRTYDEEGKTVFSLRSDIQGTEEQRRKLLEFGKLAYAVEDAQAKNPTLNIDDLIKNDNGILLQTANILAKDQLENLKAITGSTKSLEKNAQSSAFTNLLFSAQANAQKNIFTTPAQIDKYARDNPKMLTTQIALGNLGSTGDLISQLMGQKTLDEWSAATDRVNAEKAEGRTGNSVLDALRKSNPALYGTIQEGGEYTDYFFGQTYDYLKKNDLLGDAETNRDDYIKKARAEQKRQLKDSIPTSGMFSYQQWGIYDKLAQDNPDEKMISPGGGSYTYSTYAAKVKEYAMTDLQKDLDNYQKELSGTSSTSPDYYKLVGQINQTRQALADLAGAANLVSTWFNIAGAVVRPTQSMILNNFYPDLTIYIDGQPIDSSRITSSSSTQPIVTPGTVVGRFGAN